MGAGVRGRSPLLGDGIRGSVRLGRLRIGMISKSAKKDGGTLKVHQCQIFIYFINKKRLKHSYILTFIFSLNSLEMES